MILGRALAHLVTGDLSRAEVHSKLLLVSVGSRQPRAGPSPPHVVRGLPFPDVGFGDQDDEVSGLASHPGQEPAVAAAPERRRVSNNECAPACLLCVPLASPSASLGPSVPNGERRP